MTRTLQLIALVACPQDERIERMPVNTILLMLNIPA